MSKIALFWEKIVKISTFLGKIARRLDILQGQALFRGVKQMLTRCVWLHNFRKFSFPISIEKRWTKDKQTDKKNKIQKEEKIKRKMTKKKTEKENRKKEK